MAAEPGALSEVVAVPDTAESVIRVGSSTNANTLGQAVAHAIYEGHKPFLRAIGAGAVNQAWKALAITRGFVAPRGLDLTVRPGFQTVTINGDEVSAMTFLVIVDGPT